MKTNKTITSTAVIAAAKYNTKHIQMFEIKFEKVFGAKETINMYYCVVQKWIMM